MPALLVGTSRRGITVWVENLGVSQAQTAPVQEWWLAKAVLQESISRGSATRRPARQRTHRGSKSSLGLVITRRLDPCRAIQRETVSEGL